MELGVGIMDADHLVRADVEAEEDEGKGKGKKRGGKQGKGKR